MAWNNKQALNDLLEPDCTSITVSTADAIKILKHASKKRGIKLKLKYNDGVVTISGKRNKKRCDWQ